MLRLMCHNHQNVSLHQKSTQMTEKTKKRIGKKNVIFTGPVQVWFSIPQIMSLNRGSGSVFGKKGP